jgi:hypothetical protein
MTLYGAQNPSFNPISVAEDAIIRELAQAGMSPREAAIEMKVRGYPRHRDTIRHYMRRNGILIDLKAAADRAKTRVRATPARVGYIRNYVYISPFEANDAFCAAFEAAYPGQRYSDHPRAAPGRDALVMHRPSSTSVMTTGGVAVYG